MHGYKKYIPLNRPGQLRGRKLYQTADGTDKGWGFRVGQNVMTQSLDNSRMYIPLDSHGQLRSGETNEPAGFDITNFACTSTTLFEWAMHKGWGLRAGQSVINRDLCTYAAIAGQWDSLVLAHRCYGLPCDEAPLNLAVTLGDLNAYMMLRALRFPRNQTGLLLRLAIRNGDLRIIDQTARDERDLHHSVIANRYANAPHPPITPLGSGWSERVMTLAASTPNSRDTIAALHHLGAPWGAETCKAAFLAGNLTSLKYLLRHGCPWSAHDRRQCLSRMHRIIDYTYDPVSEIFMAPQQTLWQHSNDVLGRRLYCARWVREKSEGRDTERHLRSCDDDPILIATDEGPTSLYMMWEIKFPSPRRGALRGETGGGSTTSQYHTMRGNPITVPHHDMAHLSAAQQSCIQARGMERSNSTEGDGPNSIQHGQQDQPMVFNIDDLLAAARPDTQWMIAAMADTDACIPSAAEQLLAKTCDVYMSRATSETGDLEILGDKPAQAAYQAPMTFETYYEDVSRTWEVNGPVALRPSADQAEPWNLSLQSLNLLLLLQKRGLTYNILVACFGSVVKTPTGKRRSSTKLVHEELSSILSTSLGVKVVLVDGAVSDPELHTSCDVVLCFDAHAFKTAAGQRVHYHPRRNLERKCRFLWRTSNPSTAWYTPPSSTDLITEARRRASAGRMSNDQKNVQGHSSSPLSAQALQTIQVRGKERSNSVNGDGPANTPPLTDDYTDQCVALVTGEQHLQIGNSSWRYRNMQREPKPLGCNLRNGPQAKQLDNMDFYDPDEDGRLHGSATMNEMQSMLIAVCIALREGKTVELYMHRADYTGFIEMPQRRLEGTLYLTGGATTQPIRQPEAQHVWTSGPKVQEPHCVRRASAWTINTEEPQAVLTHVHKAWTSHRYVHISPPDDGTLQYLADPADPALKGTFKINFDDGNEKYNDWTGLQADKRLVFIDKNTALPLHNQANPTLQPQDTTVARITASTPSPKRKQTKFGHNAAGQTGARPRQEDYKG